MRRLKTIAALALAGLAGCGSEDDAVTLVPVSGTVTLNGKPMAEATITFMPDASNKATTPGADATGPEGNYKLMYKNRSGVAPGKYKVVITPAAPKPAEVSGAFVNDPYMAKLAVDSARSNGGAKKEALNVKGEFEAEVSAKGDVLDFDVKGKPSSATTAKR